MKFVMFPYASYVHSHNMGLLREKYWLLHEKSKHKQELNHHFMHNCTDSQQEVTYTQACFLFDREAALETGNHSAVSLLTLV